jgi:hypothetical protein
LAGDPRLSSPSRSSSATEQRFPRNGSSAIVVLGMSSSSAWSRRYAVLAKYRLLRDALSHAAALSQAAVIAWRVRSRSGV